jgi:enoyl-CoA hydratase/carnithine racemase
MNNLNPLLTINGAVATITLRRASHHNRLDPSDLAALSEHITSAQNNPQIQLLILTGSGDSTFCSGYTIEAIASELDERFEQVLNQLERCEVPTLCALNGHVYGGGIDLALCCDFRLGLIGMKAFMPAARFGLHYHPSGLRRFTTQLGAARAKQLLLTGMTLDSEQLLQADFVLELFVDITALHVRVAQYADALAQCEPTVVRTMKQHINAINQVPDPALLDRSHYLRSLQSAALKERLAARTKLS